jgi:cytochrome c oxidase assembly protein subunit 15
METKSHYYDSLISKWLFFCASLVLIMVFIGGYTRLSGAGLSITEWKPIVGIIPPMTQESFEIEFEKYKQSPEYNMINKNISLEDFKEIYLIEYFHRLFGRLIGVIFFVPLYMILRSKIINFKLKKSLVIIFGLGIIQAIAGWVMVKSGLISKPYVDHIKLSIHLSFACILFLLLLKNAYLTKFGLYNIKVPIVKNIHSKNLFILFILLFVQLFLGGMTAGLKAGYLYNQFPLMGSSIYPQELITQNNFLDIFKDPSSVQFLHRVNAYLIIFYSLYLAIKHKNCLFYFEILALIFLQIIVGILIILYSVPMNLALFHQLFAFIVIGYVFINIIKNNGTIV